MRGHAPGERRGATAVRPDAKPAFARQPASAWAQGPRASCDNASHSVSDGWSMGIFWNELSAIWSAFAQGRPSPLPELPLQYADFALWQREWLQGAVLDEQLSFWKKNLAGAPVTELPHDFARPAIQSFSARNTSPVRNFGAPSRQPQSLVSACRPRARDIHAGTDTFFRAIPPTPTRAGPASSGC